MTKKTSAKKISKPHRAGLPVASAFMERGEVSRGFLYSVGFLAAGFIFARLFKRDEAPQAWQGGHAARVGATIMGIQTAVQHAQITKVPPASVRVQFTWSNTTKNFQGTAIPWGYRLQAIVIDVAKNLVVNRGIFPPSPSSYQIFQPGTQTTTIDVPTKSSTTGSNLPPGFYLVEVQVDGATSDPTGALTQTLTLLANKRSTDIVIIAAASGPALPAGSIGTITVSNRFARFGAGR